MHVLLPIETSIVIGAMWRHFCWLCFYLPCMCVLCQRHHTLYNSLETAETTLGNTILAHEKYIVFLT